jgi:hypothetical protein
VRLKEEKLRPARYLKRKEGTARPVGQELLGFNPNKNRKRKSTG